MKSTMLVATLAFALIAGFAAAQDGDAFELLDEEGSIIKWKTVEVVADPVKTGGAAGKWVGAETGRTFSTPDIPTDWTPYSKLVFDLHSATANGAKMVIQATSPGENGPGDYFIYTLTVDWEGWKTVEVPLKGFGKARAPAGWNNISAFTLHCKGWNVEPMEDTVWVFDNMKLVK